MKIVVDIQLERNYQLGDIIHLRLVSFHQANGMIQTEDVTPLPGAVTLYECDGCGIGVMAKEDGSLPDGWQVQKLEDGSNRFVCDFDDCRSGRYCRVCGCTEGDACIDGANLPCHWVEAPEGTNTGLCSGCAGAKEAENKMRFTCQPR